MRLKLRLVQDGKIVFEMPLLTKDWRKEELRNELDIIEDDFQRISKIFDALSHATRLRMMRSLMEEESQTMSFADFVHDLNLNPKIVWENSRKLREGGLLKKTERGKYSCPEFGQTVFMLISLALRHLKESLENIDDLQGGGTSDI